MPQVTPRIALVTELYPPSIGGQQTRFEALATRLRDLGASVTVVCTMHAPGLAAEEEAEGIRILRGPFLPKYMEPLLRHTVRSPVGMVRFALRARRVLSRNTFDFIYFNQWPYLHILLAPRRSRKMAGIDWCEMRDEAIHYLPQRLLPRLVPLNLSVSNWTAQRFQALAGVEVGYLPTGVDLNRYYPTVGERNGLLFLGRLVENKNLPLLVRAFAWYRELGGSEELTIAGSGPEESTTRQELAKLTPKVRESVNLLGGVPESKKVDLLATSKLLLIPSLREGFPNVVAEAMASGLPVATVSSPENATAHLVRLYNIGTVGDPTPESFALAISRALANTGDYSSHCTEAAREIDWSVLAAQLYKYCLALKDKVPE
jgi:glycosyltransferase involved in cell wall biosynthesis